MGPINEFTDAEVEELIYQVGDVIMDIDLGNKQLPERYQTAYFMLKTAHSMLGDLIVREQS